MCVREGGGDGGQVYVPPHNTYTEPSQRWCYTITDHILLQRNIDQGLALPCSPVHHTADRTNTWLTVQPVLFTLYIDVSI